MTMFEISVVQWSAVLSLWAVYLAVWAVRRVLYVPPRPRHPLVDRDRGNKKL